MGRVKAKHKKTTKLTNLTRSLVFRINYEDSDTQTFWGRMIGTVLICPSHPELVRVLQWPGPRHQFE